MQRPANIFFIIKKGLEVPNLVLQKDEKVVNLALVSQTCSEIYVHLTGFTFAGAGGTMEQSFI